jgi:hypothetical protein
VREFYAQFTGNKEVPEDIKEFRDIKLKDYSKTPQCATNARSTGKFTSELKTDTTERYTLFSKYAQHVQSMMLNANKNQEKLVQIINQLFEKQSDPNGAESVRIHKDLTEAKLQQLVVDARKLIIELYLKCEMDYQEGLNIYEAIVQSSIVKTTEKQVRELTALKDKYANALNVSPGIGSPITKDTEKEKPEENKETGNPEENKEKDKEKGEDKGENQEKETEIKVPYISLDKPSPPKESSPLEIAEKEQINQENMDSKEEIVKPVDIPMNKESVVGEVIDKRDPKYAEEKYILAGEQEEKENK